MKTDTEYSKRTFIFEREDYQRVVYYIEKRANDKKEFNNITLYFFGNKGTIKANILKKTFEFTKNFDEDLLGDLEEVTVEGELN